MPEDCVLIEVRDRSQALEFADLCCGLLPLRHGTVWFLGRDWAATPHELAAALRGRIGQVCGINSWINFLTADANILLPQLHHTRIPESLLRERAAALSQDFGLPGLPMTSLNELTFDDLVRADCVRAFLGEPQLVIVKSPELDQIVGLRPTVLSALTAVLNRQAACIWLTSSDSVWNDRTLPATKRLRLTDNGLVSSRAPIGQATAH
jgi:phospholipid/cholesterol/gamma-HCH transport system ATP-binding protein